MTSTPTFRAEHVGSLLRPGTLRRAFRQHTAAELSDTEFAAVTDAAIRDAVAMQESVGLRTVTDGEFRRSSYWAHFVAAVDGLDIAPALFEFSNDDGGTAAFTAPLVTGPVKRTQPISAAEFAFLRAATDRVPKITMPSPSTMHFWRGTQTFAPGTYDDADPHRRLPSPDLDGFFADLTAVFREEIAELATAGCTYVQLDEVALAMLCDPAVRAQVARRGEDAETLVDRYVGAVRDAVAGRPSAVAASMHVCRGNYKGHWMASGGYEPVAEKVFGDTGLDALFLEFDSPRAGDFAPLRHVAGATHVVLGLVSSKTPELESRDELLRRIEAASTYLPIERLGISPQCGFASTVAGNPVTEDVQRRKLALVVEVAAEVWGS